MKVDLYFARSEAPDYGDKQPDFGGIFDSIELIKRRARAMRPPSSWVALAFNADGFLKYIFEGVSRPDAEAIRPVKRKDKYSNEGREITVKNWQVAFGTVKKEHALQGKTEVVGPIPGHMHEGGLISFTPDSRA